MIVEFSVFVKYNQEIVFSTNSVCELSFHGSVGMYFFIFMYSDIHEWDAKTYGAVDLK